MYFSPHEQHNIVTLQHNQPIHFFSNQLGNCSCDTQVNGNISRSETRADETSIGWEKKNKVIFSSRKLLLVCNEISSCGLLDAKKKINKSNVKCDPLERVKMQACVVISSSEWYKLRSQLSFYHSYLSFCCDHTL